MQYEHPAGSARPHEFCLVHAQPHRQLAEGRSGPVRLAGAQSPVCRESSKAATLEPCPSRTVSSPSTSPISSVARSSPPKPTAPESSCVSTKPRASRRLPRYPCRSSTRSLPPPKRTWSRRTNPRLFRFLTAIRFRSPSVLSGSKPSASSTGQTRPFPAFPAWKPSRSQTWKWSCPGAPARTRPGASATSTSIAAPRKTSSLRSSIWLGARLPPPIRDRPQLNYGGWINRRLEPDTTYYYRIAPVDRWNNQGPVSPPVAVKTLRSSEKNAVPIQVQALRAILISDLTPQNYVNLLFRTDPESDVHLYEIHRSNQPAFEIDASTRVGVADANGIVKGSNEYGHVPIDHRMSEYDHMMWQDDTREAVQHLLLSSLRRR